MICQEISIKEIDFENETFRISEEVISVPLTASIRIIGQLNPVVLLKSNLQYRIVCGFRRLNALRQLNTPTVLARILESGSSGSLDFFDLALWDNLSHRQLNPLEKARVLYKLKNDFGVSDWRSTRIYLARMDLKPNEVLRAHMVLHESHPDFRRHFKEGRLTQASMEYLSTIPSSSRETIALSLEKIRLSASLQRKFFSLLDDLAAMNGAEPGKPLEDPQVREVLNNPRLSPAQRGENVYAILYRLRYPRVAQAEKMFVERKQSLGLPGSIRITADPLF
ncbi:MAG: ParB N-terminal domain-containing protein [Acidobacteriota bacterium]